LTNHHARYVRASRSFGGKGTQIRHSARAKATVPERIAGLPTCLDDISHRHGGRHELNLDPAQVSTNLSGQKLK